MMVTFGCGDMFERLFAITPGDIAGGGKCGDIAAAAGEIIF